MPFDSTTAATAGRKGGQRTTKAPESVRNKPLYVRVSQKELNMIDAKAKNEGLSRVELVVRAVSER